MAIGRLVGLVPTYNEGALAAGAIRSLLPHVDNVIVYEGPVGDAPATGDPTDLTEFRRNSRVVVTVGDWETEAGKRNEMLRSTRRMPTPTWGVYLDADEVFVGAEYLREYIWAAEQRAEPGRDTSALPVLISEVDGSVGRVHRIIRLDLLDRHVLSMSQLQFKGQEVIATFPVIPVWRPHEPITADEYGGYRGPILTGTPHIHHRAYYRPPRRGEYRLHAQEIKDFDEQFGIKSNAVPVHQDPGFIVAHEQDAPPPFDPFNILGG